MSCVRCWAAISAALLSLALAGCERQDTGLAEPASVEDGAPDAPADGVEGAVAASPGEEGRASPTPPAAPPPESALAPTELEVGITRGALVGALGDCGERVKFLEPRSYRRTLEVFQPRAGECVDRFGERHFVVVGEQVERVEPGLRAKVTPHTGDGAHESLPLQLSN